MRGTQTIETPRLIMRRFVMEDAPAMFAGWANDPKAARWMNWAPHRDVTETETILAEWIRDYSRDDYYSWAVTLCEDGTLIGSLGILHNSYSSLPGEFTPGYCFGTRWWGQGYATEALKAAIEAFHAAEPEVTRLYCMHAEANEASGRVMQKAGFGYLEPTSYTNSVGITHPSKLYRLDF